MFIRMVVEVFLFFLFHGFHSFLFHYPTNNNNLTRREIEKQLPVPYLIRGPYLQSATSTSMIIRWRTNVPCQSVVKYGMQKDSLLQEEIKKGAATEHLVKLSGLNPMTRYYYSIEDGNGSVVQKGEDNFFFTLPVPGKEGSYRIGVFGDCGNNSSNQKEVKAQVEKYISKEGMNAWILLGDNAYGRGTDAEYQKNFFDIYKDNLLKKYPLFPAPGNHDYYGAKGAKINRNVAYFKNFSMPVRGEAGGVPSHSSAFYSFDIGNIHFISLDSYGKEKGYTRLYDTLGPQIRWVKKDLAAYRNKKRGWVIVYWHHPPYTMGSHNSDNEGELVQIRTNVLRIMERYGVDIILCGHSHVYERSRLMKGHYGNEMSFMASKHVLNNSSALYNGSSLSCPYIKDSANKGTVYVVTGSAGALGGRQKTFPHNAMFYSNDRIGGASMIEVNENRLDFKWISADGEIRDYFVMMKDVNKKNTYKIKKGETLCLTASFIGNYQWNGENGKERSLIVAPQKSTVYTVKDEHSCLMDMFDVEVVE